MALPQLDPEEQRVLGVLLEKQVTVPATYPMTLAAVRTGCKTRLQASEHLPCPHPLADGQQAVGRETTGGRRGHNRFAAGQRVNRGGHSE